MGTEKQPINWNLVGIVVGVAFLIFLVAKGWELTAVKVGPLTVELHPGKAKPAASQPVLQTPPSQSANVSAPVSGAFVLYRDVWYGPFGDGYGLKYNSFGGFSVWNPYILNSWGMLGVEIPYPDPGFRLPRNQWHSLLQSRFSVYVDNAGTVFGYYN